MQAAIVLLHMLEDIPVYLVALCSIMTKSENEEDEEVETLNKIC